MTACAWCEVAMEEEERKRLASDEMGMDIYKFREKLAQMGLKYFWKGAGDLARRPAFRMPDSPCCPAGFS
jgi:hypothetical protein